MTAASTIAATNSGTGTGFLRLPPEIRNLVLVNIRDRRTMKRLGQTCKTLHCEAMSWLYHRITIEAHSPDDLPRLRRSLEPLLRIAQKKKLKGGLRQQTRYSTTSSPTTLDLGYAGYVRRLLIDIACPDSAAFPHCQRHELFRYIEEVFENLSMLEVVVTNLVTESIARRITSLEHLRAFNIYSSLFMSPTAEDFLRQVKGLKNLVLPASVPDPVVRSMALNSAPTLRTLSLSRVGSEVFQKGSGTSLVRGPLCLSSLTSLTLGSLDWDKKPPEETIRQMLESIDFLKLERLVILGPCTTNSPLFESLAGVFGTASRPYLTTLEIRIWMNVEAVVRFISSFHTLTSLALSYQRLLDRDDLEYLLPAILKHTRLETLRIPYRKKGSEGVPLSAQTVGAIVDGLPVLRNFEFAPEEENLKEIGQKLARAANLRSIVCFHRGLAFQSLDSAGNLSGEAFVPPLLTPATAVPPTQMIERPKWYCCTELPIFSLRGSTLPLVFRPSGSCARYAYVDH
ncbi:hypothetical protein PG985_004814 [Apiospora marii]|uniref:uncharacterized protein n=1 Tax=Apiospora marii TaxID=335849 RepID=UPI0031319D59